MTEAPAGGDLGDKRGCGACEQFGVDPAQSGIADVLRRRHTEIFDKSALDGPDAEAGLGGQFGQRNRTTETFCDAVTYQLDRRGRGRGLRAVQLLGELMARGQEESRHQRMRQRLGDDRQREQSSTSRNVADSVSNRETGVSGYAVGCNRSVLPLRLCTPWCDRGSDSALS